jgi:hypothetical protein
MCHEAAFGVLNGEITYSCLSPDKSHFDFSKKPMKSTFPIFAFSVEFVDELSSSFGTCS